MRLWLGNTPSTAAESTVEEHVEDLLSIKAVTPKARACSPPLPPPTQACALLVPIPVIGRPLVTITQAAEGLGDGCTRQEETS